MTDPLSAFIERRGAAILDGGLASELAVRGIDLNDPLWSARALIERPDAVAAVHRDYLAAGADVIETATYQATIPGFVARGMSESEAANLLVTGVELARRERDVFWEHYPAVGGRARPLVAASIGGYGAYLGDGSEYRGDYGIGVPALIEWHRPRAHILESSGADLLAFETIPSADEAAAIALLLAETDGPPAWISFQARDAESLADGTPIEVAVARLERCARLLAVGVNCVAPALVTPLLLRCAAATSKPLVAYPNRGGVWDAASDSWIGGGEAVPFDRLARDWRAAGARLIGGCCRTTPADIRTIAATL